MKYVPVPFCLPQLSLAAGNTKTEEELKKMIKVIQPVPDGYWLSVTASYGYPADPNVSGEGGGCQCWVDSAYQKLLSEKMYALKFEPVRWEYTGLAWPIYTGHASIRVEIKARTDRLPTPISTTLYWVARISFPEDINPAILGSEVPPKLSNGTTVPSAAPPTRDPALLQILNNLPTDIHP